MIEAKPKGHPLIGVEAQSAKYAGALPPGIPAHGSPLPFSYESTGAVTQFTNLLEPDARSREVFTFIVPRNCFAWSRLDAQVRTKLKALPALDGSKLWSVQISGDREPGEVTRQEQARGPDPHGDRVGQDVHAVNACYRLIKFGGRSGSCSLWIAATSVDRPTVIPTVRESGERA